MPYRYRPSSLNCIPLCHEPGDSPSNRNGSRSTAHGRPRSALRARRSNAPCARRAEENSASFSSCSWRSPGAGRAAGDTARTASAGSISRAPGVDSKRILEKGGQHLPRHDQSGTASPDCRSGQGWCLGGLVGAAYMAVPWSVWDIYVNHPGFGTTSGQALKEVWTS